MNFYNDKASFDAFVEMMRAEQHRLDADSSGALKYHIELVRLLARDWAALRPACEARLRARGIDPGALSVADG